MEIEANTWIHPLTSEKLIKHNFINPKKNDLYVDSLADSDVWLADEDMQARKHVLRTAQVFGSSFSEADTMVETSVVRKIRENDFYYVKHYDSVNRCTHSGLEEEHMILSRVMSDDIFAPVDDMWAHTNWFLPGSNLRLVLDRKNVPEQGDIYLSTRGEVLSADYDFPDYYASRPILRKAKVIEGLIETGRRGCPNQGEKYVIETEGFVKTYNKNSFNILEYQTDTNQAPEWEYQGELYTIDYIGKPDINEIILKDGKATKAKDETRTTLLKRINSIAHDQLIAFESLLHDSKNAIELLESCLRGEASYDSDFEQLLKEIETFVNPYSPARYSTRDEIRKAKLLTMKFGPRFYTKEQREFMKKVVKNRKPLEAPSYPLEEDNSEKPKYYILKPRRNNGIEFDY